MKKIISVFLSGFLLFLTASAEGYSHLSEESYTTAQTFYRGIARVTRGGMTAIIDTDANFVLPFDERPKVIRKNGLIMVMDENGYAGFFDKNGRQLTDYIYDTYPDTHEKTKVTTAHYFHNRFDGDGTSDLIPISRNKKFGFLNSRGEEQIPPTFDYVYGFSDGMARICSGSEITKYGTYIDCKYGLIREDGTIVLPADTYWYIGDFKHGYAAGGNGPAQMLDKNGQIRDLGGLIYQSTNGIYITAGDSEGRTTILDMAGKEVLPLDFTPKTIWQDLIVLADTRLINRQGETLYTAPEGGRLQTIWEDEIHPFLRISIPAGDVEGHSLFGLVRTDGTVILPPIYESVKVMGEGLLYARTTTENILLDEQGRLVCLLNGDLPEVCREGKFVLRDYHTMQQVYVKNPLRDIAVLYNGNSLFFDVPPLLEDGRTLVPLRAIFEAMEAEVSWDDRTKTVYAKRGETHIVLPVGAPSFTKNGTEILLDVPAKIEKGRTLIPLRAVADALGCKVDWQGETRTVLLFS